MLGSIIGINRHRIGTDGSGVTTLVCLHGCSLRCKYCLNPSAWKAKEAFLTCSPKELYAQVNVDSLYFRATNGGITFGGGEPCLQYEFINEFKNLCDVSWEINIETSLNVPTRNVASLITTVNHWYVDVKDMNKKLYEAYTGGKIAPMLKNLNLLIASKANVTVRLPHIPLFNTVEDVTCSKSILQEMGIDNIDEFTYRTK